MARQEQALASFNRGIVSRFGVARSDIKRIALSAETQTNWIPRVLGSMSIRPGLEYIGTTKSSSPARMIPFVFAVDDTAILEFTDSYLRIWVGDTLVTRVTVATTIGALTTYTDNSESGGVATPASPLVITGTGTNSGIADQTVTLGTGASGLQHALRITITNGPVLLRVGSSQGADDYVSEASLGTGTHSITLTPTGTFYVRFFSRSAHTVTVSACTIEAAGTLELPTPYTAAYLSYIRTDCTGDVIFVAVSDFQQRLIERRANGSWSIVLYAPEDGPFGYINTTPITLAPSALTGNITVTASKALFESTDVGRLYQITSESQRVSGTTTGAPPAAGDWTDALLVQGVGTDRTITITIAGLTASTVTLQRSFGDTTNWADVPSSTFTADNSYSYADTYDNQIVYYRIGVKQADYGGADSITYEISYPTGSITGIVRVTAFATSLSVSAEVLNTLGDTVATDLWKSGDWSDTTGWPSGVALHEARCWWSGKARIWGSIAGVFSSFDEDVVGDSGLINRALVGAVDKIAWMCSNQRLMIGTASAELSARSSSMDEPLTPTSFNVKSTSTHGSANVTALKLDHSVVFAQRNGNKLYKMDYNIQKYDYESGDLCNIIPDICNPGVVRLAIQRQPDTRIHAVLADGTVAMLVTDSAEEVNAWIKIETDGSIEDVVVMPGQLGQTDDLTYYIVRRTINGAAVRYLEKMAQSTECAGATVCKLSDSFVVVTQASSPTVTGLAHLEGESVCVWADGIDVGTASDYTQTHTVSGGAITLATPATTIVVGMPYTAAFLSMKLGSPTQSMPTVLNRLKNINHIGLIMADTHPKGVRFGQDATILDEMPGEEQSKPVDPDVIWTAYDENRIEFPGSWNTDTRIYITAQAPRPCTMLAVDMKMEVS
jgi:hypothetical protein